MNLILALNVWVDRWVLTAILGLQRNRENVNTRRYTSWPPGGKGVVACFLGLRNSRRARDLDHTLSSLVIECRRSAGRPYSPKTLQQFDKRRTMVLTRISLMVEISALRTSMNRRTQSSRKRRTRFEKGTPWNGKTRKTRSNTNSFFFTTVSFLIYDEHHLLIRKSSRHCIQQQLRNILCQRIKHGMSVVPMVPEICTMCAKSISTF